MPAKNVQDLSWLRPKVCARSDLPMTGDRLTGVIGIDGSLAPVQVRDGLPSVYYGYAQAAAIWLDVEAINIAYTQ